MSALISKEYKQLLEQVHDKDINWGRGPALSIYEVCAFIKRKHVFFKTVLDYGCGKGMLTYVLGPSINITGYDPCIPRFAKLPEPHEYTICCDVLEHIEEDKLDNVLQHISEVTKNSVFFVVGVSLSRKILPDGRNTHINLKTREEWITRLSKYFELEIASAGFNTLRYQGKSRHWLK